MDRTQACLIFFFFNDTATTEIYTLSLHDALPISVNAVVGLGLAQVHHQAMAQFADGQGWLAAQLFEQLRSEEHTSELQSQSNLVCRLLLEKKKTKCEKSIQCYMEILR